MMRDKKKHPTPTAAAGAGVSLAARRDGRQDPALIPPALSAAGLGL